ncbi:MAG: hypothetical protein U0930_10700 [Pirellulales bacterium]
MLSYLHDEFVDFKVDPNWESSGLSWKDLSETMGLSTGTIDMNAMKTARLGPGRFQWNAGAWFGSLLGSSAWMLMVALFLFGNGDRLLAIAPTVAFAIVLFGTINLWSRRYSVYPFPALIAMLAVLAIFTPTIWIMVQNWASPKSLAAMNWPRPPWNAIFVFALVPSLMVWFSYLERNTLSPSKKLDHDI